MAPSTPETPNDHLNQGDLYVVETWNDLVSEINLLKKAQAASKSKYEKEQIAWNILTLKQKLNDVNIDDLRKRAEGELKRPSIDLVLKWKLESFIKSADELKANMDRIRAEAKDAAKVARISFLSQFDQMKAVAGTEEKPAAEVKPVDPAVASTEVKPVEPAVASTVKPVTTPVVKPTVSTETLPAHVDTLEVQVAKIKDIIKAIAVPKGFTLKINPNNQVVLQKDWVRRIFTISENPKLNTTETITQWMNEKVGQINTVIEKDPDMFSEAKEILENIHKIKGLEKVKKLKELGFTCSKEGIIRPNTLHWEEESGSSNYNIRLADGYEVKDGKIVQKVNILTSEKAKVGQSAIEYFKELVDSWYKPTEHKENKSTGVVTDVFTKVGEKSIKVTHNFKENNNILKVEEV